MARVERNRKWLKENFREGYESKNQIPIDKEIESKVDEALEHAYYDEGVREISESRSWAKWLDVVMKYEKTGLYVYQEHTTNIKDYVYLIRERNTNYCKVGRTTCSNGDDPMASALNRLDSLQTGNPRRLDLVGVFPVSTPQTELTIHKRFIEYRGVGEWFYFDSEVLGNLLDADWRAKNHIY